MIIMFTDRLQEMHQKLRRQTECFLAGQLISVIPELRLPTGRSVLQYLFIYTTRATTDIAQPKRQLAV